MTHELGDDRDSAKRDGDARDRDARDRDERGRPRNARGRDALGRPLPRGEAGVVALPDDLRLSPEESLAQAQRLLEDGFPFQAHEVLEAAWKSAPESERQLWQGLAQLAVGITHAARGNRRGSSALLSRAAQRLAGYADDRPHGVDIVAVLDWVRRAELELDAAATGPADVGLPRLL